MLLITAQGCLVVAEENKVKNKQFKRYFVRLTSSRMAFFYKWNKYKTFVMVEQYRIMNLQFKRSILTALCKSTYLKVAYIEGLG